MNRALFLLWTGIPGVLLVLGGLAWWFCVGSPRDSGTTAPPPWFLDVTEQTGLTFVHDPGPTNSYFMPGIMGSGAALFDFDNDGRLDVYLLQNAGPTSRLTNQLFHQRPDGTFENVSAGSGLDIAGFDMGVAVGDINNDGWPDILVTQYGDIKLFLNNGNGTFTDITKAAGLDNPLWGTSACFVDYNRDGWLDLVVVNYLENDPTHRCLDRQGKREFCGPDFFPGSVTKLYRNCGRQSGTDPTLVRFEDVTVASGLGRFPGPGLGVVCADFNGDRWPDIFVANDGKPNHLWINQKDGTFKEEALLRGLAVDAAGKPGASMGIALADVDGDGLLDVFVTHMTTQQHTLWRQGSRGLFSDQTALRGLTVNPWSGTGFGTVLADFDHDGAPDLAFVNGDIKRARIAPDLAVTKELGPFWSWYAQRNQLFVNEGAGKFRDISLESESFCARAKVGRGLAWGDLDGDGAIDLLVTSIAAPARLYRNVAPKRGHWLLVRAIDPALKRDAYGAEVHVEAGGRRWVGLINPGSSYLCSNDPRAHFGLGQPDHVDRIRVVWPDGTEEMFSGRPADQKVVLRKGEGKAVARSGLEKTP